jgi:MFS family permease
VASLNESKSGVNATTALDLNSKKDLVYDYQFFPAFVLFVLLDVLGLPMIAICSSSLFTKLIDNKAQGFGQGIQRGVLGFGTIFGPLCAGPFVQRPIYLLACTLMFITFIILFVILSYKRLIPKESNQKAVR